MCNIVKCRQVVPTKPRGRTIFSSIIKSFIQYTHQTMLVNKVKTNELDEKMSHVFNCWQRMSEKCANGTFERPFNDSEMSGLALIKSHTHTKST